MTIDHSTLTKGQVRKLNALHKSVGDDIAENAGVPTKRVRIRTGRMSNLFIRRVSQRMSGMGSLGKF